MNQTITVLAPIKLAAGNTETELLNASERFQAEFVRHQPGIIRRELVRRDNGQFMDIIQFKDRKSLEEVMAEEQQSEVCLAFFAIMDMSSDTHIEICESLNTYLN
ncbi:hypothetical protein [Gynuella sunshinyii]|uniref:ABM domain-containing protein n=1 Tax=Gynuella sunshinyii YC6258 TaxID=1445510 RepID=A0A0C5VKT4_9GAMM|nr:hypothetical protein [Gynuella sunshinyii]AJQ94916.1 hypothetical Protein YC6258_02878 [Gynuella sunshinyii YC6258]